MHSGGVAQTAAYAADGVDAALRREVLDRAACAQRWAFAARAAPTASHVARSMVPRA
jgi:hypothetical protein